ncbi:MAG: hypothetical protein IJA61_03270 [Clostridia bacterium]|nr:hypothetical protein [Clostridia bacterium]
MTEKEYYQYFIDKFGINAQVLMAIEEMSELSNVLTKYLRFGEDSLDQKYKENIIEELADVKNMIGQLSYYFGDNDVAKTQKEKLERTILRIKEKEHENSNPKNS